MSVTFSPVHRGTFTHDGVQRECWIGRPGEDGPSLNLANANAGMILDILCIESGGEDGLYGEFSPAEMIKRISFARSHVARNPSEFGRSYQESGGPGTGQCRMIQCGMDAEGVLDRLARLEAVALACVDGEMVGWA